MWGGVTKGEEEGTHHRGGGVAKEERGTHHRGVEMMGGRGNR